MRSRLQCWRCLCHPIHPHPAPFLHQQHHHLRYIHLDIDLNHLDLQEAYTMFHVPAGIFDQESEAQKATFVRAVEAVNDDRTILTKSLVTTDINDYPHDDSFKASKKLCEMVQSEVAGIFGPTKYLS